MKILIFLLLCTITVFANIGVVSSLVGKAKVQRATNTLELSISDSINEKDLIVTESRSRVQVILNDKTVITIGPNSEFSFDRYSADSQNPELNFKANKGFFKAVSGKIGKIAPNRFKIKTRSATIGIRGTIFMAEIDMDSEKIACLKGAITIDIPGKQMVVPSGEMVSIEKNIPIQKKIEMKEFKKAKQEELSVTQKERVDVSNTTQEVLDQFNTIKVEEDTEDIQIIEKVTDLTTIQSTVTRPENSDQIGPLN